MAARDNKIPKNIQSRAGAGRPKGSPNKTTALLKDAILEAARMAGNPLDKDDPEGLVMYLQYQAKENPAPFLSLLGKVLPMTIGGDKDNPLEFVGTIRLCGPDD